MRPARRILVAFAVGSIGSVMVCAYAGCSPKAKAVEFDPKLQLQWPGVPDESRQVIGDTKHYSAMLTLRRPNGPAFYHASVSDDSIYAQQSPSEVLHSFTFAFRKDETSRKQIKVGPKEYLGLDIASTSIVGDRPLFTRKVVFVAGTRLTSVSVSGRDADFISGPEVSAFFDSLTVSE
jgi:hypothetical protein